MSLNDDEGAAVQRFGDNSVVWSDLHQGTGDIVVNRYFERTFPWPVEFEMWTIPEGGHEGLHTHGRDDPDGYAGAREVYLIVEGSARVTLGDASHSLGPGDAISADPATPRGIANVGAGPLRLVVLSDPGPPLT
ncbi:MAG: cupin domain-containing protein [Actinomycetales bacterium]|nr:cupin domain-containing protein [Actinomycetales bacterium]